MIADKVEHRPVGYMWYSVKEARIVANESWDQHCQAINDDWRYCMTLPISDVTRHASPSVLPSHHPYWSFVVYIGYKKALINAIRNQRELEAHRKAMDVPGVEHTAMWPKYCNIGGMIAAAIDFQKFLRGKIREFQKKMAGR